MLKEVAEFLVKQGLSTELKFQELPDHPLDAVRIFNPHDGTFEDYIPPPPVPEMLVTSFGDIFTACQAYKTDPAKSLCIVSDVVITIQLDRNDPRLGWIRMPLIRSDACNWLLNHNGRELSHAQFLEALRTTLRNAVKREIRDSIEAITVTQMRNLTSVQQQGLQSMKGENTKQLTGTGLPNGLQETINIDFRWFEHPATPLVKLSPELLTRFRREVEIAFELHLPASELDELRRQAKYEVVAALSPVLSELQIPIVA